VDVSAGGDNSCAILQDGSVWCWGDVQHGLLGDDVQIDTSTPTRIDLPAPATHVSIGAGWEGAQPLGAHACALLDDASVYCWGVNTRGQLGTGDTMSSAKPRKTKIGNVSSLHSGGIHTCATSNGTLHCWGGNADGQVGNGSLVDAASPVPVMTGVTTFAAGGFHTCAAWANGVSCWGRNEHGQLGTGDYVPRTMPMPLAGSNLPAVLELALGFEHSCARTVSNVFCWGSDQFGQLGVSSVELTQTAPHAVGLPGVGLPGATRVAVGGAHSAALAAGALSMWGDNTYAQLTSLGSPTDLPTQVAITGPTRVALGARHTCVIDEDKRVLCWGDNAHYQVGGFGEQQLTPVVVAWK
jgi:alpha-tubulin suppressor-like RCC1 family protein